MADQIGIKPSSGVREVVKEVREAVSYEDLAEALASGYPHGNVTKNMLLEILRIIVPTVAYVATDEILQGQRSLRALWNRVKWREEVKKEFKRAAKKVGRLAVVYIASKFENNEYIGTGMVRRALELELSKIKDKTKLSLAERQTEGIINSILASGG